VSTLDSSAANPRFPLFDSLRAIAALSVFLVHLPLAARMSADNPLRPYLMQMNAGVAVFFLISGFLLYRPFARARYARESRPAVLPYALRRALRITPAYWVALPIVVLVLGASGEATTTTHVFTPRGLVSYFGFLQIYDSRTLLGGISAAWTLCVEASFYALLPLWALMMRRLPHRSRAGFLRSELAGLAVLFVMGSAWTAVAAAQTHLTGAVFVDVTEIKPWLYVLPSFLDHFALGMGLAVLSVATAGRPDAPRAVRLVERVPWLPWLAAAVSFFLLAHVVGWFHADFAWSYSVIHLLQGLFALSLLLPAVFSGDGRRWVRTVLSNRALTWVGLVSYSLYLWHAAVIARLARAGGLDSLGDLGFSGVALVVSLAIAGVSFYAIERPALRLGRRLLRRRRFEDADIRMAALVEYPDGRRADAS